MAILTKDVDRMLRSQAALIEMQKTQAVQHNEHLHITDTLKRAFAHIDENGRKIESTAAALKTVSVEVEKIKTGVKTIGFMTRYWPIFVGMAAAAYAGLEALKGGG